MTFADKLAAAKELLAQKGMKVRTYDPGIFVFFRKIGLQLPPPQFLYFSQNFLIMTILGFIISIIWWLLGLPGIETGRVDAALITSLIIGSVIGLIMATIFFYGSYKYSVPKWDEFSPEENQINHNS